MPIGSPGSPVFIASGGKAVRPMTLPGRAVYRRPARYTIAGITRDASNNPLAGCAVEVFETGSGLLRGATVSDANGNYSIDVTGGEGLTFFAVAYKAGTSDVAGTTVNTLVGTPS
jgi:hypothetical protein